MFEHLQTNANEMSSDRPYSTLSLRVIPSEKIAQLLECPICQDTYKDPRALPCLHSYCLECIEPMYVPGKPFACPYCRQEFLFVSPLKEVLPCDLKVKALLETRPIEFNATKICASCCKHPAIGICAHCAQHTCVACIEDHERKVKCQLQDVVKSLKKNVSQFEDVQVKIVESIRQNLTNVRSSIKYEHQRLKDLLEKAELELMKEVDGFEKRAISKVERVHSEIVPQINHTKKFIDNCGTLTSTSDVGMNQIMIAFTDGMKLLRHIGAVQCDQDAQRLMEVVPKLNFERNPYLEMTTQGFNIGNLFLKFHYKTKRRQRHPVVMSERPFIQRIDHLHTASPLGVQSSPSGHILSSSSCVIQQPNLGDTFRRHYTDSKHCSGTFSHSSTAAHMFMRFSRALRSDKKAPSR